MPSRPPRRPPRETPSAFTYDRERGTYRRRSSGRYVSRVEVRAAIDYALEREQRMVQRLGMRLRNRTLRLDQWQEQMMTSLKSIHLWSAAAAKGGWGELSAADYGRVGQRLREQYGYLDAFAIQLEEGEADMMEHRFIVRVQMYVEAARNTYELITRELMRELGMEEEKNILHPADHCSGCLEAAEAGWVPIGTLIPVGERECLTHCKCTMIYRESP